ncbi:kinase [Virgibacillus kekensis]|uniref:Kinase n=1 Tax=Virgibacillus kekensis TaxID=202261 RepID=A0ABV9DK89_9BACI
MNNLDIIRDRLPKPKSGEKKIVAVDGLSRSGKTTLTIKMQKLLQEKSIPVHVFHIDDYITNRNKRYNTGYEAWYEYYQLQWEVTWLKENFFNKLKTSNEFYLPKYNPKTEGHIAQTVTLPKTAVIIIEGVFLQREEWQDVYDYIIFMDADRESRFNRESKKVKQHMDKFRNRYWMAEDYYLNKQHPKEHADLIIHN